MPPTRHSPGQRLTPNRAVPYLSRSSLTPMPAIGGHVSDIDGGAVSETVKESNEENHGDQEPIQLPKPKFESFKGSYLVEKINKGHLDLNPKYQRGVVWTDAAQNSFISSLIMNVSPPMIYLNEKRPGLFPKSEAARYACVDGKQRLTSLQKVLMGVIPFKHEGQQLWAFDNGTDFTTASGKKRNENIMPVEMKERSEDVEFVCTVYPKLSRPEEILLFQRLQLGKALTVAERVRAQDGKWETLAKSFELDYFEAVELIHGGRANGFRAILQSFIQIMECCQQTEYYYEIPDAKFGEGAVKAFCADGTSLTDEMKKHLKNVFSAFAFFALETDNPLTSMELEGTQTFAPIEFVAIACLISQVIDHTPDDNVMLEHTKELRKALRAAHRDLRMNSTVWRTAWRFIRDK